MRPCGCNRAAATVDGRNTIARYPRLASPLFLSPLSSSVRREDERERKRDTKGEESEREEAEERHRASERETAGRRRESGMNFYELRKLICVFR